jgi:hypothetical protein
VVITKLKLNIRNNKMAKNAYSKKMKDQVKASMAKKCPKGYKKMGEACVKITPSKKGAKATAKTILGINL